MTQKVILDPIKFYLNYAPEQLEQLLSIERRQFAQPWDKEDFEELYQRKLSMLHAEVNGTIVGYRVYERFRDSIRVIHIGIDPDCEGNGVERALLGKLSERMANEKRELYVISHECDAKLLQLLRDSGATPVPPLLKHPENDHSDIIFQYPVHQHSHSRGR